MSLVASIPSEFIICPPLDYPLRLAFEVGFYGAPRINGRAGGSCRSDHFASVNPSGTPGLHQIHEAVDLASGRGSCVYAVYSGTIVGKESGQLVIDHQDDGAGYASRYLHITPGPKAIGDRVVKGEAIAAVGPHVAGDHLHFELSHWVTAGPHENPDAEAVPVDPTRLLYRWEEALALDYAALGSIDATASADLDAEAAGAALVAAYGSAGLDPPEAAVITALAAGSVWRIAGAEIVHLLRAERGAISVFEEAYGSRRTRLGRIDRIGLTRRWSYPTFVIEADGASYGIPLHQAPPADQLLVELLRSAYDDHSPVDLEIRRSAFWRMDGSLDDLEGVVVGVRLG